VLGFGSLDRVVQRCRQRLFEVLRDKAIAQRLVAVVVPIRDRFQPFDKIEAEIGVERRDLLLATAVGNAADCCNLGFDCGDRAVPEDDNVRGGELRSVAEGGSIRVNPCIGVRVNANERIVASGRVRRPGSDSDSGIVIPRAVLERTDTAGGIAVSLGVAFERVVADGGVVLARVGIERESTAGGVTATLGVETERVNAGGGL
jgi:hypothetical protein